MKKQIVAMAVLFLLLAACSKPTESSSAEPAPADSAVADEEQAAPDAVETSEPEPEWEVPSLSVVVDGEDILLVDMREPLVRSFFAGCDGYDLHSFEIIVTSMENPQAEQKRGNIDPRYTYPLYLLATSESEDYFQVAQKLLDGEKLADQLAPLPRAYGGILFDDEGFPISIAEFGDGGYGHYSPVADEMDRYDDASERPAAFRRYFAGHILIVTEELRNELERRAFDPSSTTVKTGWFGYPGFFFSDGEHELIYVTGDSRTGYYTNGAYITPEELGKDAARFAADEEIRRQSEPPLAPGENPPTG